MMTLEEWKVFFTWTDDHSFTIGYLFGAASSAALVIVVTLIQYLSWRFMGELPRRNRASSSRRT